MTTTATTVRSAMAEAGVALREQDRVSADLSAVPYAEQVVGLTRVDGKKAVEERPIKFDTVKRKTNDLYQGTTKIVKQGKVGIEVRTFRETYLDGKLDSPQLVSSQVTEKPVTEVLLVGTKKMPDNAPAADGLNWAALANCESGGNPQAYNSAGPFYGLYQFMESTWHAVGGVGLPTDASSSEQTYRAQILYNRSGAGQWPVCGQLPVQLTVTAGDDAPALLGPAEVRELAARARHPPDQDARAELRASTRTRCAGSCAPPSCAPDDHRGRGRTRASAR